MSRNLSALFDLPAVQPFEVLARAARDVLGRETPDVYERLRLARRGEIQALAGEAAAHFQTLEAELRRRILAQCEVFAHAQTLANLVERPPPVSGDERFPTPELQALLSAGP